MSEAAWNKAFTQGSRALQDRLKKVHASNPKFQAWMKSSGHGSGESVKQASKEVKPTARVKTLQTKSLQAYGATKGAKVGGEHGSGEMKDTIAPLTRDQHSKVQAAERAAKAAAKKAAPAKPKKPLSQAERMAAIARAVKKAKSKDRFDVPTVDPDDADHDDLRDVHNQMHIRRGYNEEVESVEEGVATAQKVMDRANVVAKTNPDPKKRFAASGLAQKAMMRTINPTGVNTGITRGGGNKTYRMVTGKVPPYQLTKKTGVSEEVELDEVTKQEAEKMLGGPVKTRTGSEPKGKLPLGFRRARNLARKAMKTVKESTTEVSEVNEMNHGKKLAKMIMAKQSQHPIAQNMGEENIVEQDDSMEKKEMAQTQLHFIKYAAEEILAFIDMGGEVEEWYQNKLSKVQSEVESLHSYIEGEKRRTGMVEEVEVVDEKVEIFHRQDPGADMERYHKDTSNPAAVLARKKAADAARTSRVAGDLKAKKMGQTMSTGNGGAVKAVSTTSQGFKKEEVEQVDEKINLAKAKMGDVVKDFYKSKAPQFKGKSMAKRREMAVAAKLGAEREAGVREEVVTEAEGTVAVTPKEKALAAHHGDKTKITYGDVIKARIKSAAAKKMGK